MRFPTSLWCVMANAGIQNCNPEARANTGSPGAKRQLRASLDHIQHLSHSSGVANKRLPGGEEADRVAPDTSMFSVPNTDGRSGLVLVEVYTHGKTYHIKKMCTAPD